MNGSTILLFYHTGLLQLEQTVAFTKRNNWTLVFGQSHRVTLGRTNTLKTYFAEQGEVQFSFLGRQGQFS